MTIPSAILMGSKPGSVAALLMLLDRGWNVPAVVVSRTVHHEWISSPTLAEVASRRGISVYAQSDLPQALGADYVISYMYRHRVTSATRARGAIGAVNFHPAPLPEYAGWAFYNMAILEHAAEYGCTCHHMDEGFDTGALIKVRRFAIDAATETAVSLERRTQREMLQLFNEFCDLAESGRPLPCVPQDPARMRYMTRDEFEAQKMIPPGADAETIQRYARAFWYPPYAGAKIKVGAAYVEVVPEAVKPHLARLLHEHDMCALLELQHCHQESLT
jgi:methionyl-tRNA formyltransferase